MKLLLDTVLFGKLYHQLSKVFMIMGRPLIRRKLLVLAVLPPPPPVIPALVFHTEQFTRGRRIKHNQNTKRKEIS